MSDNFDPKIAPMIHFSSHISRNSGFTMLELMIVIAMIMMLFAISIFPYNYYMDRARVENTIDTISQEWILAHNDVRNGILYDDSHHANLYVILKKWSHTIDIMSSVWWDTPKKIYKSFSFDGNEEILGFSGVELGSTQTVSYHIAPPFATGSYSTGTTESTLTGIIMTVGYSWATLDSRRARNILLRPYYN